MNRVERTVRGWILPLLGTFTDAELADTEPAPPPSVPDSAPAVPVEEGDEWITFGGAK